MNRLSRRSILKTSIKHKLFKIATFGSVFILLLTLIVVAFPKHSSVLAAFRSSRFRMPTPTPRIRTRPSPTPRPKPTATSTPRPTSTPIPTITSSTTIIPQSSQLRFGVVVEDHTDATGQLSTLQNELHNRIQTISIFKQFGLPGNADFNPSDLSYVRTQGMKVQLAWEPWNPEEGTHQSVDILSAIPAGGYDNYIRNFADSVKAYAGPVTIRFAHEMNSSDYPWGQRPQEYVKAYRHIHDLFVSQGVTNVTWMWSVNVAINQPSEFNAYYPGNDVVNVIGIDGFNFGTTADYGGWRSFKEVFDPSYTYLSTHYSQPIIISETGSSEQGGNKATWVNDMFQKGIPSYPRVHELIWFDLLKETDWRINSSDSTLKAFENNL